MHVMQVSTDSAAALSIQPHVLERGAAPSDSAAPAMPVSTALVARVDSHPSDLAAAGTAAEEAVEGSGPVDCTADLEVCNDDGSSSQQVLPVCLRDSCLQVSMPVCLQRVQCQTKVHSLSWPCAGNGRNVNFSTNASKRCKDSSLQTCASFTSACCS